MAQLMNPDRPKFAATNSDDVDARMGAAHVATHTFVPDVAPKVAATDDSVKAPEKPVEAPSKETRTLALEDGRKVVCEDLTGGWNPNNGQFRVTVYAADGSVAGTENGSGAFLRQHRDVDVTAFTK